MNLETLVERACLESGYNDTDDIAAAEKFARHWDEHIWNHALWKDSLVTCDVAVTPDTNDDHAEGILFLPEVIDRVVAVRLASNQVVVRGQEHYYRMDFDSFAATGTPLEFVILPPAWFTWRASPSENYLSISGAVADAAIQVKIVWMDGIGRRTTTTTTVGVGSQLEPESDDSVTLLRMAKPVTTAAIGFNAEGDGTVLYSLSAADTTSPSYQRIRLLPMPTVDMTVKVLGKAKYEPLDFDQQEPALRNCTNALLAFIRGSLKRRGGENVAAQLEFQEGNALLKQVEQIEALQAANNSRFTPEDGFGPEHGIGPM